MQPAQRHSRLSHHFPGCLQMDACLDPSFSIFNPAPSLCPKKAVEDCSKSLGPCDHVGDAVKTSGSGLELIQL